MNPIKIPSTSQKKTNRLCCGTEASSQAEVVAQAADGRGASRGWSTRTLWVPRTGTDAI